MKKRPKRRQSIEPTAPLKSIVRRKSKISGWGVYALEPITKNSRIVHYAGEKISWKESDRREKKYLKKGSTVYIEGQLQTRKWQDQSGNDRYTTEIVLQKFRGELVLLDARGEGGGGGGSFGADEYGSGGFGGSAIGGGGSKPQSRPQPAAFDSDLDDDVPF